jgi:hypothetical protein
VNAIEKPTTRPRRRHLGAPQPPLGPLPIDVRSRPPSRQRPTRGKRGCHLGATRRPPRGLR